MFRKGDGTFEFRQPYLIVHIVKVLLLDDTVSQKHAPVGKPLLHKDTDGKMKNIDCIVGKQLACLHIFTVQLKMTVPCLDINICVLTTNPKFLTKSREKIIKRYLLDEMSMAWFAN